MTYEQAMSALKAAGTEQTRKTWSRHGVDPARSFGVLYAALYTIAKQAGTDQALAERLWSSGNHDARVLATHVADPLAIPAATLESWMRTCDNYVLTDAVSSLAIRTPHAPARARAWIEDAGEWVAAAGWNVVAGLAMTGAPVTAMRVKKQETPAAGAVDDAALSALLARIEREIGRAKNRVKHSMNNVVISIGLRGGALRERAIAAARRIGRVDVDHGRTSCKTPNAVEYILKAEARQKPGPAAASAARAKAPTRPVAPSKRLPAKAARKRVARA